jgi:CheY-like chemotaxis protein
MSVSVLVVDSSEQFGTLIGQTLEDTGYYQVALATDGASAIKLGQESEPRLAIIDFDLPDVSGPELIRQLRGTHPELAVIGIPLHDDPNDPELRDLGLNGLLSKPFYLPDLPKIVADALDQPSDAPKTLAPSRIDPALEPGVTTADALPAWLADQDQAGQYLTQLFFEISAKGAILTRHQDLWAFAGEMDQEQFQALNTVVIDEWRDKGGRGALAKYLMLPGTNQDYLFYATAIQTGLVLTLIYPPDVRFSDVRRQTEYLAKSLSEIDPSSG